VRPAALRVIVPAKIDNKANEESSE
jgi:hypothetical protein